MKKKTMTILLLAVMAVSLILPVMAEPVDLNMPSSLEIVFRADGVEYEGLNVTIYRIADISADGSMSLAENFKKYPVNIYDVESQAEWHNIAETLAAYAVADDIEPYRTGVTGEGGTVKFENLVPGMYLTLSVRHISETEVVVFENFLSVIPRYNYEGKYDYDLTVIPKHEKYTPSKQMKEFKVLKQWKDGGREGSRPRSVLVEILKDGEVYTTQVLNAKNNWSYTWTAEDDGSTWSAVERDIPNGYFVTVNSDGSTLIVTNITDDSIAPPPTGDVGSNLPMIIILTFAGGMLLLVSAWRKRREE